MARARLLKPGFFANEELAEVPPHARLLFAGLWTLADRSGRLEDRPVRIRAALFPYEADVDCDELLGRLMAKSFIDRYCVDGVRYIQVCRFNAHQTPHHREPESKIPAKTESPGKPKAGRRPAQVKPESSPSDPVAVPGDPVSGDPVEEPRRFARLTITQRRDVERHMKAAAHAELDANPDLGDGELAERLKRIAAYSLKVIDYDSSWIAELIQGVRATRKRRAA